MIVGFFYILRATSDLEKNRILAVWRGGRSSGHTNLNDRDIISRNGRKWKIPPQIKLIQVYTTIINSMF